MREERDESETGVRERAVKGVGKVPVTRGGNNNNFIPSSSFSIPRPAH